MRETIGTITREEALAPVRPEEIAATTKANDAPRPERDRGRAIVPVPEDAPRCNCRHGDLGLPSHVWQYCDAEGRLLCQVARYDTAPAEKEFRPWTFRQYADGRRAWAPLDLDPPRPIYNLDKLAARPAAPVIVAEGEKAADAAGEIFADFVATTPTHGAQSQALADWTSLRGRRVVVWPDADAPGRAFADAVARLARDAGAAELRIVEVPATFPEAWDLADEPPEPWTAAELRRLLDGARTLPRELPEIRVSAEPGAVALALDRAERAVADANAGTLFTRAEMLCALVRGTKQPRGVKRPPEAPVLRPLAEGRLLEMLATSARWLKWNVREKEWRPTLPPSAYAAMIRDRGSWQSIASVSAIAEAPTMRADGSILDEPGLDPDTGVLFVPSGDFERVPERPKRSDAEGATAGLLEPFSEFPFRSTADSAAFLAALLTVLVRPAIDGPVPLFVFSANAPGVGKSRLADAISRLATGRDAARVTMPTDDAETRKLLLALALEAAPLILLDNASGAIGSDALSAAVTSCTVRDRLLGVSRTVTAPLVGTVFVTGNGLAFRRDLGRRVVLSELLTDLEHPEDRSGFRIPDLLGYLAEHRRWLVPAALTVLRAFHLAGRPAHGKPPRGGFEQWDGLVRGALVWAGAGDPCGNLDEIRSRADADLEALRAALAAWADRFGPQPKTASEAVEATKCDEELRGALAGICGRELSSRTLGYGLRKHAERIVGGMRFTRSGEDRISGTRWTVAAAGDPAGDRAIAGDVSRTPRKFGSAKNGGVVESMTRHDPITRNERPWSDLDEWR